MKRLAVILCVAMLGSGCALRLPDASSDVPPPGRVIVVGKLVLDPPIAESEQNTQWNVIGEGALRRRVWMATGPKAVPINPDAQKMSDWQNHLRAEWGRTFMVTAPSRRTWLRGAKAQLDASIGSEIWFPGGYWFEAPEGAQAIYIGTLYYKRGDFYSIESVEVRDEYREALREYRKRFGERATLTKALMQPAR